MLVDRWRTAHDKLTTIQIFPLKDIKPFSEIKQAPYNILIPYKPLIKLPKIPISQTARICPSGQSSRKPSAQIPMRFQGIIETSTAQNLSQWQAWMFEDLRLCSCWTLVVVLKITVGGRVSIAHHDVNYIWGREHVYCSGKVVPEGRRKAKERNLVDFCYGFRSRTCARPRVANFCGRSYYC